MQRAYVLVVHHLTGIHRAITELNNIQVCQKRTDSF